jgi:hypothetical protein
MLRQGRLEQALLIERRFKQHRDRLSSINQRRGLSIRTLALESRSKSLKHKLQAGSTHRRKAKQQ